MSAVDTYELSLTVHCPFCDADPGVICVTAGDNACMVDHRPHMHKQREIRAMRKAMEVLAGGHGWPGTTLKALMQDRGKVSG